MLSVHFVLGSLNSGLCDKGLGIGKYHVLSQLIAPTLEYSDPRHYKGPAVNALKAPCFTLGVFLAKTLQGPSLEWYDLTLSQASPGFYVSSVKVF